MENDNILTTNEKIIMDLFWECGRPLTSTELVQMCEAYKWSQEYILLLIKNIRRKGLLMEHGIVRVSTRRARQFVPTKTKEEYVAYVALSAGISPDSFTRTAVAIAKKLGDKEELIERLEELIKELKEQPDD